MTGASPLGRYASVDRDEDDLCTVELLDAPLLLWQRANEHHDELIRELSLLSLTYDVRSLPLRLVELIDLLVGRNGVAAPRADPQQDLALPAGLERIDLAYEVSRSDGAAAGAVRALLEEVAKFCRVGADLLTLEPSPVLTRFFRWYVEQFQVQCDGGPPTPWPGPWS